MAAKEKALTTYIPECDRWIKRFEDRLAIWWTPYNEKIYKAARSLPGASWEYNKQEMVVSAEFYNEIQAFAKNGNSVLPKGRRNYRKIQGTGSRL